MSNKQVAALTKVALLVGVIAVAVAVTYIVLVSRSEQANPNAIYPPAALESYPPIHLRGVRMQASSCSTASACSQQLDCLQTAGVTIIYYSIFSESEKEAYYHSSLLLHRSFDSLAYMVPQAHARGMKVYALMAVGRMGWPEHPEWNLRSSHPNVDDDWLDLSIPAARSFVNDVAEEIVTNYDVEGMLLDYIRWGVNINHVSPHLSLKDISLTVQGVYERVKAVRPEAVVTASVFRSRASGGYVGQAWYDWLDDGYIDYVTPMAYVDDKELSTLLNEWYDSGHFPQRIVPRLSVAWFRPTRPKGVEEILQQIEICYDAGATGMTLWDDRYICNNPDLVEALGAGGW